MPTTRRPPRQAPPPAGGPARSLPSRRVERRRRVPATADQLWRHVTGAEWLGLDDEDPTVGAHVRLRDPFGGDGPRDARVVEVDAGRSLVLEWWPAGRPDYRSVVTIEVTPAGAGAVVRVVEEAVPVVDVTARGRVWSSCLQALAGMVEASRSPFALSVG